MLHDGSMSFRPLTDEEIETVLRRERVVRIAFSDVAGAYVVPLFYCWLDGALHGITTPGRKLDLGAADASVGFQLDSTPSTGPWEWASVAGTGQFAAIDDPAELAAVEMRLNDVYADAPPWVEDELRQRFAERGRAGWRIRPAAVHGRALGPGA